MTQYPDTLYIVIASVRMPLLCSCDMPVVTLYHIPVCGFSLAERLWHPAPASPRSGCQPQRQGEQGGHAAEGRRVLQMAQGRQSQDAGRRETAQSWDRSTQPGNQVRDDDDDDDEFCYFLYKNKDVFYVTKKDVVFCVIIKMLCSV